MNQMKILKLAKILNKFTLDDIATTLELNDEKEKKVLEYLDSFVQNGLIKKISGEQYLYLDKRDTKTENTSKSTVPFNINDITPAFIDITKDKDYEIYLNAPLWAKKKADKYLSAIQAAGTIRGKTLPFFLQQWNKQFPDKKMSIASFKRAKKMLLEEGVASLLAKYDSHPNNGKSSVNNELYQYFKEFYLAFEAIPMTDAINLADKKFREANPDIGWYNPPSYICFRNRLLKEFTREEIKQFRCSKFTGVKNNERKTAHPH